MSSKVTFLSMIYIALLIAVPHVAAMQDAVPKTRPIHISDITRWVNKYPDDKISGIKIFAVEEFESQLKLELGERKFREFSKIEIAGPHLPVERFGEYLHFGVCQVHNCGHTFVFLIHPKTAKVYICEEHHNLSNSRQTVEVWSNWYGPKGRVQVNDQQCEAFDEMRHETDWQKTISLIPAQIR